MDNSFRFSILEMFANVMFILNGLLLLLGITSLYLFIKLAFRAIQALDIYLDEKRK